MEEIDEKLLAFAEANKEIFSKLRLFWPLCFEWMRLIEDIGEPHVLALLFVARTLSPEMHSAVVEWRDLYAEGRKLHPLGRGSTGKTKQGRPVIWKGYEGYRLVVLVKLIREEKHCSLADAIRQAVKNDPVLKSCKTIVRLLKKDPHYLTELQIRYQEAAKHWSYATDLDEDEARNRDVWDAARRAVGAIERLAAAIRTLSPEHRHCLIESVGRCLAGIWFSLPPERQRQLKELPVRIKELERWAEVAKRLFGTNVDERYQRLYGTTKDEWAQRVLMNDGPKDFS
jgi:hypothetical protein